MLNLYCFLKIKEKKTIYLVTNTEKFIYKKVLESAYFLH